MRITHVCPNLMRLSSPTSEFSVSAFRILYKKTMLIDLPKCSVNFIEI